MPNYPLSQINLTNSTYPSGVTLVIKDADARTALAAIQALIPSQATSSNQLADKDFVNSSIATSTATFRGSFNLVADLSLSVGATHEQIAAALGTHIATADNNDYAFVLIPTSTSTPTEIAAVERYKFNGTAWAFEYALNNSGFTAAQWAAINSGITALLVAKLQALPTKAEIDTALAAKEDVANKVTELSDSSTDTQYGSAKAVWTAIKNAVLSVKSWVEEKLTSKADKVALKNGTLVPKLAENLESWEERGALPTEDEWSGAVRTAGGDMSIISSQGAELVSIKAGAGLFKASALRTTGFNLLHNATAVGTGFYFLVPKLPFGTFGTATEPNGVLFTDNDNNNLTPTVRFKALSAGVPTSVNDGDACAYTDSNGYRFYTTSQAGYIIVSGITFANTCAHIAWSRRYNEFVSPTAESDAGSSISLTSVIASIHDYGYMIGIEKQGEVVADMIERISSTQVKWYRNCDRVKPTWTTEDNGDDTYTHTATISAMKADGAASLGSTALVISGQTISYTDNSATASTDYVLYELATAANGTANLATHLGIEDWGLEVLDGVEGVAEMTMQYYMGYPDALAAIAQIKMKEVVQTVEDTDADLDNEIALNDTLGDATARTMSVGEMPMVCGRPMVLYGAGVPAEATVPTNWDRETMGAWNGIPCHIGQLYINTSAANGGLYYAKDTTAVGDWKQA